LDDLTLMTGWPALEYVRLSRIEAETSGVEHSSLTGIADAIALERLWSDRLRLTTQRVLASDSGRQDETLRSNRDALRTAIDAADASAMIPNAARVLDSFQVRVRRLLSGSGPAAHRCRRPA